MDPRLIVEVYDIPNRTKWLDRINLAEQIQAQQLEAQNIRAKGEQIYRNQMLNLERQKLNATKSQNLQVPGMAIGSYNPVTGQLEKLPTEKEAKEMNDGRIKIVNIVHNIDRLIDHVQKEGFTFTGTSADKIGKSLSADIMFDLKSKEFKNLGAALTETEKLPLMKLIPEDPGSFLSSSYLSPWGGNTVTVLKELRQRVIDYQNIAGRQKGYTELEQTPLRGFTPSR